MNIIVTDSQNLITRYRTLFMCALLVFVHSLSAPEYSSAADEDRLTELQTTTSVTKRLIEKTPHLIPKLSDVVVKTIPLFISSHETLLIEIDHHICMHPHILCSLGSLSPPFTEITDVGVFSIS